jgi:hypothetical protein
LPKTPDTLWFRLFSNGGFQTQAFTELAQLLSEMIFLFRDSVGMFIQFFPANGSNTVLCKNPDDRQLANEITVMHCGSPLTLPRSYFVDRSTAAKAISAFIDHGTGEQPPGFNWIET